MSRQARTKSSTGIYHVILRGINRQDIFEDNEDFLRFIETLSRYKEICEYELYGYCLMSNHIHLLIKEGKEPISQIMKRIGTSYVYWYNKKYDRIGHLFQDRYKSEMVEDDTYLLVVLRYIHRNPVKAGIVSKMDQYEYHSYANYFKAGTIIDQDLILAMFDSVHHKALQAFQKFMEVINSDKCLDDDEVRKHIPDSDVKVLIKSKTGSDNPQALLLLSKVERDSIIRDIREEGISIRQLSRITGLGRRIIEKA